MIAVFKRELAAYFKSMPGYLFTAFLLIFTGVYVMVYNLSGYSARFEYALSAVSFIYMVAVPVLTMRSMAEEKKQKTDQLLYALPLRMSSVVMGKYLAMVTVLLIPCAVMGVYPLLFSLWGQVNVLTAFGALLAFFLLGAALLSIGLFISAMTDNQVAAAVITLVVMLLLYLMGSLDGYLSPMSRASMLALSLLICAFGLLLYVLTSNIPASCLITALSIGALYWYYVAEPLVFYGLFAKVLSSLSLFDRFYGFINGVFDLRHAVYFLSVSAFFVFLTVKALEKRRWAA